MKIKLFSMVISRSYNNSMDHQRMMNFLRELYTETSGFENWLPTRFENNSREMDLGIKVWEDNGDLVGSVVPEKPLVYFIQLHPNYLWLYNEMVDCIESYSQTNWVGKLAVVEMEGQIHRENILMEHGFIREGIYGIFRVRSLEKNIPEYKLPNGFRVRSVTFDDFDELTTCIRQVFGHTDYYREHLEINASASYYVPDLDLVAVNEYGRIVSFCTFRLDSPSGFTELEPMGTIHEYRNQGIGRALLAEGFKRLKKYNPSLLYIGGAANNPPANRLYELTGFTERYNLIRWEKLLD
jgi:ribosomal protein S18 acetylase RimI-like enzyme